MTSPRYSILITSFRSLRFLEECLGSLVNLEGPAYEVLFLENGSPEPEADWVEKNIVDPRFRVFRLPQTRFFTGGVNFLAERALGEFVVLFNSDTRVDPNWLKILDTYLQATGFEGANSDVREMTHPEKPGDESFCVDPFGLTHYVPIRKSDAMPLVARGLGLAMKRHIFNRLGALDDDFKMYFEDIDLCWRAGLQNYRIGYAPGAILYHVGQGSSVKSFFIWNRFRGRRNRIWTFVKNAGPVLLAVFIPAHLLICLFSIMSNLVIGRFRNSVAETAALAAAIYHIRIPLSKRGDIQRKRRISDAELVKRGFLVLRVKFLGKLLGFSFGRKPV